MPKQLETTEQGVIALRHRIVLLLPKSCYAVKHSEMTDHLTCLLDKDLGSE